MGVFKVVMILVLLGMVAYFFDEMIRNTFRRIDKERIIEFRNNFATTLKTEEGELKEYLLLMNSAAYSSFGNYLHKNFGISKLILTKDEYRMGYTAYIQLLTTMNIDQIKQLPGVYGVYELGSLALEYTYEKYKEVVNE